MTEITVFLDDSNQIEGIRGENHSSRVQKLKRTAFRTVEAIFGWFERSRTAAGDPVGNTVCAAISAIFELFHQQVSNLPDAAVEENRSTKQTEWQININFDQLSREQSHQTRALFENGLKVLERIRDTYPGLVSIQQQPRT